MDKLGCLPAHHRFSAVPHGLRASICMPVRHGHRDVPGSVLFQNLHITWRSKQAGQHTYRRGYVRGYCTGAWKYYS